jgi:hypothetical protein
VDVKLLVVLAACSGGKPKVVASQDAKPIVHAVVASDAARAVDATIPPGKGDVSIRIEWKDVPIDARTPKPCGPDVAPTTTWGIPETVVTIDAQGGPALPAGRVTVDKCFTPRVQVAAGSLVIASAALQPTALTLDGHNVMLPIAGHEVEAPLAAGRHELVAAGAHAWVVSAPWAAVTDASGVAVLRDVPSGVYPVTAWQPTTNRSAKGEVTVMPNALAEVTLQLQASP